MTRVIRRATIVAAALMLASVATVAAKEGPVTEPSPTGTIEFEAGAPCAFAVRVEPVIDEVMVTTWPERPNGDVYQIYSGRLIGLATNLATGETLRFDNSGALHAVFHADGSFEVRYAAPSLMWNFAEEPGRDGLWILKRGSASEMYDADGNLTAQRLPGRGALTDLCARLA